MDVAALGRPGTGVRGGGEQRVREADAPAADGDELGVDGRAERRRTVAAGDGSDQRQRRVGERSGGEQRGSGSPPARPPPWRRPDRAANPAPGRARRWVTLVQRARQLEREQRIARRRRVDRSERRSRQDDAEPVRAAGGGAARGSGPRRPRRSNAGRARSGANPSLERSDSRSARSSATCSSASRRAAESSTRVEAASSHWRSSTATSTGRSPASARRTPRKPSATPRWSTPPGSGDSSRSAARSACACGAGSSSKAVVHAVEQVADTRVAPAWPLSRAVCAASTWYCSRGCVDRVLPERRLPGARLSFQQERAGPVVPAQELRQRSELVLPADDRGRHGRDPRPWRESALPRARRRARRAGRRRGSCRPRRTHPRAAAARAGSRPGAGARA